MGLQGVTGGYKGLQGVTSGDKGVTGGLQRIIETFFSLERSLYTFSWSVLHKNQS